MWPSAVAPFHSPVPQEYGQTHSVCHSDVTHAKLTPSCLPLWRAATVTLREAADPSSRSRYSNGGWAAAGRRKRARAEGEREAGAGAGRQEAARPTAPQGRSLTNAARPPKAWHLGQLALTKGHLCPAQ